ncbi:MAG TPA: hypothetical protein VJV75_08145 [Candidatus Polarisedimenticolia bacterium]|nr:hypothetical protein [Candidatus Polarisedimenticolia bacterium]
MARIEPKSKPAGGGSRPPLEPTEPLPAHVAWLQVVVLLGIPLGLLLLGKVVLGRFFPGLGY